MVNSDTYNKNLRIHRLMGQLILITLIYLASGIALGFLFYFLNNYQFLYLLGLASLLYLLVYTTIAIIFRKLTGDKNEKKSKLLYLLVFSY
jgi:chromate transport protein ChrA